MNKREVNICSPGYHASCALCCGSHNSTLSRAAMEETFKKRYMRREKNLPEEYDTAGELPGKRLPDGIQCPHIGFINHERAIIGCLIYNETESHDDFFLSTCRTFYCRAADLLSDREVLFAAKLFRDWYYYSLFINEIPLLKKTISRWENPEALPPEEIEKLQRLLEHSLMKDE